MDYNEDNYEIIFDLRLAGIVDKALPGGGLFNFIDNLAVLDTSEHLSLLTSLPANVIPPRRIETWLKVAGWLKILPPKVRRVMVAMGKFAGPSQAALYLKLSPPTVSKYYRLGIQMIVDDIAKSLNVSSANEMQAKSDCVLNSSEATN